MQVAQLKKHKLTALLVFVQSAMICAIISNALYICTTDLHRVSVASGIKEDGLYYVTTEHIGHGATGASDARAELNAIEGVSGVATAAEVTHGLPLGGGSATTELCRNTSASSFSRSDDCLDTQTYGGSSNLLPTLGVKIQEGRGFTASDFQGEHWHTALLTRSLADRFFPDGNAVGKLLENGGRTITVVGITNDVLRPSVRGTTVDRMLMFTPDVGSSSVHSFVFRIGPDRASKQRMAGGIKNALLELDPSLSILEGPESYREIRRDYFSEDVAVTMIAGGVAFILALIAFVGIYGLSSFWVTSRRRSTAIRRALGARKSDVIAFFQLENLYITSAGVLVGSIFAIMGGNAIRGIYELGRMPLHFVALTSLSIIAIGQLAVLGPSYRASTAKQIALSARR